MKKKILIMAVLLITVLSLIAMTNTVKANCTNENCGGEGECTSRTDATCDATCCPVEMDGKCYPTLTKAIAAVTNGENVTITLRGDVTENDGVKIENKTGKITIKGDGQHKIKAGNSKDIITVKNSSLILDNCKIGEETSNDPNKFGTAAGVKLCDSANVEIINGSEIIAKYGIWVNGKNSTLVVDHSTVKGWAALDITNGKDSQDQAEGNVVTVKNNSTLIGESLYTGDTNTYATIVLGGQKDLKLTIVDSTVQAISKDDSNPQWLIASGSAYKDVTGADIEVKGNSKLEADEKHNGVIFDVANKDGNSDNGNKLTIASTVTTKGNMFPADDNIVYVTIYDRHGNGKTITVKKNEKVPEKELTVTDAPKGYMFRGWYTDEELKTIFNQSEAVTANISLYPGFEKTTTAEDLRTSIRALIAKAEGEENMTEDLKNAVAEARAVLEETGSTYGELQEALTKLQKAYDAFKNGTISDNQPNKTPEEDENLDTTPKTGDYVMDVSVLLGVLILANMIYFKMTKRNRR